MSEEMSDREYIDWRLEELERMRDEIDYLRERIEKLEAKQ